MKACLLVGLALLAASVEAAPRVVATIDDPAGDDVGNGSLILPQRNDFESGDLDLVRLQLSRDDEGYWFEATFRNPIRDPGNAFGTVGGEPLSNIARKGFYQFNLDVYIDTDRVNGSGNTFTLPGRKASIAPAHAWERAVILTPRPEAMRSRLIEVLERQFPDRPKGEAAASVDASMFFPTRVRVRGKSVVFLVPAGFAGESDPKTWAITAFVTGARTDVGLNLSVLPGAKGTLEELDLGVMQPVVGRPRDTFGFAGGVAPAPIVDLLAPAPEVQARLLGARAELLGVALNDAVPAAAAGASPTAAVAAPSGLGRGERIAAPAGPAKA
jgi:C-terminal binding-module, SLH-like, of glucodextranase